MKKLAVLFTAIALVCFAVPAMAVDWNFYGSARMATYWTSNDYDESALRQGTDVNTDDSELDWALQGNSRIGARVKHEAVSGRFEFAVKDDDGGGTVDSRLIYGTWNFGAGSLKVGKDYTPVSQFISGQAFDGDAGLLGIGTMYGLRRGQIALTFGGFEIALIDPSTSQLGVVGSNALRTNAINSAQDIIDSGIENASADQVLLGQALLAIAEDLPELGSSNGDVDQVIPKIEAKWGMGFDTWNFNIRGGYQYYSIEDVAPIGGGSTNDIDVTSWIIGADVGWNFGPGYLKGAGSYGQNIGTGGWYTNGTESAGLATWDGDDDTKDVKTWMAALVAGIKVSDMMAFEGGIGFISDDPDYEVPLTGEDLDNKQTAWNAYVQGVFTLAPGVYLIPEIGYYDFDKDYADNDAGSLWYAGGKWQIDF
jgi:hypothetical protein